MRAQCITVNLANQGRRQVRARSDGGCMSSDGGGLLLQAVDQRIGLTQRLAACFVDHRNPRRYEHSLQRLFGLALGYEDISDDDRPRDDSLLGFVIGWMGDMVEKLTLGHGNCGGLPQRIGSCCGAESAGRGATPSREHRQPQLGAGGPSAMP